jgi:CheY-like chemotaxis protein
LVEAHGGSVEAQSDGPGRGATFTITLPVHAVDVSQAPFLNAPRGDLDTAAPADRRIDAPQAIALDDVRILIVEDDRDSLELVRHVLEAAGARVTAVSSARAAIDEPGPFDVIISDIGMPEMDGYSLVERIRARDADVPAIALTAYVGQANADRALRAGFREHVAKPIDAVKLLATVRRWARKAATGAAD